MQTRTAMVAGVAAGAMAIAASAHAQTAEATPSPAELEAKIQALQAQVRALSAQVRQAPVVTSLADLVQDENSPDRPRPGPVGSGNEQSVGGGAAGTQGSNGGPALRFDGGLRASDSQGDAFQVQGRILLDAVQEDVSRDNNQFPGQTKASDYHARNLRGRQVQLGVRGQIGSKFAYLLEGGWQNGGSPQWAYALLEYKVAKDDSLIFGNEKVAGLENITSEKYRVFMDAGPFNDLTDLSYVLSASWVHTDADYTFWASIQGASLNNPDVTQGAFGSTSANERLGGTLRGTWKPIHTPTQKLHLGLWARYRNRGGETPLGYTAWDDTNYHSETNTGASLLSTGAVGDSDVSIGGEFAYVLHNIGLQAEAADIMVNRISTGRNATLGGDDFDIRTAYGLVSWFPTGEMRNYLTTGQFGRVKVLNPVDRGGTGAFELAARVAYADLSDLKGNTTSPVAMQTELANAGRYVSGTFGLNWYPISYVKFMGNYTHGEITNRRTGLTKNDAEVNVFQLRSQIDF